MATYEELLAQGATPVENTPAKKPTYEQLVAMGAKEIAKPSKMESGLRGAAQGLSFGFADEATAALDALTGNDSYDEALKKVRDLYSNAQKENPLTYGASELGGGIATSFIPGLNVAKAGSLAGAVGRSAASAALSGAGSSEGTALDKLMAAGTGAGIGGALGGAGYGLSKGMQKMSGKLAKTATGATGREQQMFSKDAGSRLLGEKVVRAFDNSEDIALRSKAMLKASGEEIGKSLKSAPPVSRDHILAQLITEKAKLQGNEGNDLVIKKLDKAIDSFAKSDKFRDASNIWDVKKTFAKKVKWLPPGMMTSGKAAANEANYTITNALTNVVEDATAKANPQLAEKFAKDRSLYALLSPVNRASERAAAKQDAIPWGGLLDITAATGGIGYSIAKDDPSPGAKALGAILGRRYVLPRLASTAAVALNSPTLRGATNKTLSNVLPNATRSVWSNLNNGE